MSIGTVNELGRSQNGKPKVKIDGKWYFAGRCSLDGMATGQRVEFQSKSFTTDSGKELWGLQSWSPIAGAAPASAVSDDAEMRFVSNVVGQAIAAKSIAEPEQIEKWAVAAKAALLAVKGQKAKPKSDFDDELPEQFYGNGEAPQRNSNEPGW